MATLGINCNLVVPIVFSWAPDAMHQAVAVATYPHSNHWWQIIMVDGVSLW